MFEPPGENQRLVGPEEMISYFQVNGVMYYVDSWGKSVNYETSFRKSTCAESISARWTSLFAEVRLASQSLYHVRYIVSSLSR